MIKAERQISPTIYTIFWRVVRGFLGGGSISRVLFVGAAPGDIPAGGVGALFAGEFGLEAALAGVPIGAVGAVGGAILQQFLGEEFVAAVVVVGPAVIKHFGEAEAEGLQGMRGAGEVAGAELL